MQLPSMIGKYELLEFLGGGMSHVYRARDTVIERTVVVKILTDEASADPESKARFLHEAKIAGGIQHDNIVSVFDYGDHGGRPFIVMEYLEGEDLRGAIREGHTGSLANRLRIAGSIAAALEYVHGRGIIHRDIKPENVHIDKNGKVKLMDFGIAKTANLSLTRTGMAMGTPYYMAPEQVAGRATTPLIDIYAFGMLFYELLTGVRGIQGDTMEQLFYQIMNQPLDPATLENAGVPPTVRDLILRCTAKAAEQRPQSLREVIEVVRRATPSTGNVSGATTRTLTTPNAPAPPAPQPPAEPRKPFAGRPVVLSLVAVIGVIAIAAAVYLWAHRVEAIPGMIYYPGGAFPFGPDKKPVNLGPFYIDETEVSNADFAEYCRATGCAPPTGAPDLPVVRVTIVQARAYAQWKGRRLPTAQEWERAARNVDAFRYPWGDAEDPKRANLLDNPTLVNHALMPVRSFAKLPEYQMAGNAWEMIDTPVTPSDAAVAMFSTLVTPAPTREERWIQIRGGSYNTPLPAAVTYEYSPIPSASPARTSVSVALKLFLKMSAAWDAKQYQQRHSYVFQYGQAVLDLLAPRKGEQILDLGCGSGQLTAAIADAGADVIGLDSSPEMLAEARAHYPAIEFRLGDAADFAMESPVDAVFSNAVLHWVKNAAGAAACIARALKPGGRFVAEFGGHGNIQAVVDALHEVLGPVETPWYYPSIGEYATVLEQSGLEPREAWLIDRPTPVEGEDGMEDWLAVFARFAPRDQLHNVAERLRPTHYKDGVWTVDYRRLRIVAHKTAL